jgi:competence protein ComEA
MKTILLALVMCFALAGAAMATVNINTATKEELVSLKGIGEKRAQEIIDYRNKHGQFKTVEDLEKVQGIGPGIMKQIRSEVSVSGATTAAKTASGTNKTKADDKTKAAKVADTKKVEPAKSDALKTEKNAKEKTSADKSKSDEKAKAEKKADEKKTDAKKTDDKSAKATTEKKTDTTK